MDKTEFKKRLQKYEQCLMSELQNTQDVTRQIEINHIPKFDEITGDYLCNINTPGLDYLNNISADYDGGIDTTNGIITYAPHINFRFSNPLQGFERNVSKEEFFGMKGFGELSDVVKEVGAMYKGLTNIGFHLVGEGHTDAIVIEDDILATFSTGSYLHRKDLTSKLETMANVLTQVRYD